MQFTIQTENTVDAFIGRPVDKLCQMSWLRGGDYALQLAIDSILSYYYGCKETSYTELDDRDWRIDIRHALRNYMWEAENWYDLLDSAPLHVCYDLIIRPFRQFINGLIEQYKKGNYAD